MVHGINTAKELEKNSKEKRTRSYNKLSRNSTVKNLEFSTRFRSNFLKPKSKDISLSNHDLMEWIKYLQIPNFKGIFSRDAHMPNNHNPCIINLDEMQNSGTHWVCCVPSGKNTLWYFHSFGMHYPKEYEMRAKKYRMKVIYNNIPYQDIYSVRCGCYCLYFLHRWSIGEDYYDILKRFSINEPYYNERFIKKYFENI